MITDPHNIIGKEVRAADGGDYGHRVLGYDPETEDYTVQAIRWSTGEPYSEHTTTIDAFKITYRYVIGSARSLMVSRP